MSLPHETPRFETEERFMDSLNEQRTSNISDEIDEEYTQADTGNSYSPPFDVPADDDEDPPHFGVEATPNPRIKRRTPAAVAVALLRSFSRKKTGATVATFTTTDCDDDATIRNPNTSTAVDSEFGTCFLKVESVPDNGSVSEGCVEAEAMMTSSVITPSQHHGMDGSSSSVSSAASGRTNTNTSNFTRIVSNARRFLRPLTEVRSTRSLQSSSSRGWVKPPDGIKIEEFTINGERTYGFCRDSSKLDFNEEYQLMKERFPSVPKYAGNPPWLTRFHPDLVRPPSRNAQI